MTVTHRHNPAGPEMLSPSGVMRELAISRRTLERYVQAGLLTPVYLPNNHRRFDPGQVRALLRQTPNQQVPGGDR